MIFYFILFIVWTLLCAALLIGLVGMLTEKAKEFLEKGKVAYLSVLMLALLLLVGIDWDIDHAQTAWGIVKGTPKAASVQVVK